MATANIYSSEYTAGPERFHNVSSFSAAVSSALGMLSGSPWLYAMVHAYTAACDSFDSWEHFIEKEDDKADGPTYDPNSSAASKYNREAGYQDLKEEKAEVI